MQDYNRDYFFDCLKSAFDQFIVVSEKLLTNKGELNEKTRVCEIASASCDHLEKGCFNLRDKVAELEVILNKCKVKLETIKSSSLIKDVNASSDSEEDPNVSPLNFSKDLNDSFNLEEAKVKAKN